MTVRFEIDEFAGGFGEGTPGCVLWRPVRTLNCVSCVVEVHEAGDIQVWLLRKNCGAELNKYLFRFTAKNKIDSIAEIRFGLIGCVRAMCNDDGSGFTSLLSELPG